MNFPIREIHPEAFAEGLIIFYISITFQRFSKALFYVLNYYLNITLDLLCPSEAPIGAKEDTTISYEVGKLRKNVLYEIFKVPPSVCRSS